MARYENGWIKIHRAILQSTVAQRDLFTFGVFVRILLMANWKESKVIFGGDKRTIYPGQLVTGLRELSPDVDEDPHMNKVRAALSYLEKCESIAQVTNNQGRIITICNWDKYQLTGEEELITSTSDAQTPHKQTTSKLQLNEEDKKERTEEYINFDLALTEYKKLQGVMKGPKAEARFKEQITTDDLFACLLTAIKHYREFLARSENSWRRPKTTFETFLGSKKSGFFWREFISLDATGKKEEKILTLDEVKALA